MPSTLIESTSSIESIHSNAPFSLKENDCHPITQPKLPFNDLFGEAKRCLKTLVRKSDLNNGCDEINRKRYIGQSLKEKYKKRRRINSAQIIHHTGSHVVGKYCFRRYFKMIPNLGRKNESEKSSCDTIYMKNAQHWMLYLPR